MLDSDPGIGCRNLQSGGLRRNHEAVAGRRQLGGFRSAVEEFHVYQNIRAGRFKSLDGDLLVDQAAITGNNPALDIGTADQGCLRLLPFLAVSGEQNVDAELVFPLGGHFPQRRIDIRRRLFQLQVAGSYFIRENRHRQHQK